MGEYRNRTTGEVKTQGEWRSANPNMSLPRTWSSATLDALDVDAVLASPAATTTAYQTSVRDGVEQDANGNWMEKYVARDMFSTTNEETAYQAQLDAEVAKSSRAGRDRRIAETDFYALSDVTMSDAMTSYRQALRDITSHKNWPDLSESDWPTKPS